MSVSPENTASGTLPELDYSKPTFVYCAIGGRNRAAAQFLSGQRFSEVFSCFQHERRHKGLEGQTGSLA